MTTIITSIPNSIASFFKNRKKTISWTVGSVGVIYLGSQWIFSKINDLAEKSSLLTRDRENLIRRFNLNLQDCQFTVLALLPALSAQILTEMNVEAASANLATLVGNERKEELERSLTLESSIETIISTKTTIPDEISHQEGVVAVATADDPEDEPLESTHSEVEAIPAEVDASPLLNASTTLNPSAMEFVPSSPSITITPPPLNESVSLSESWDQIAVNEQAAESEAEERSPPLPAIEIPGSTRAELWNEIKILSFTRAITSLYTLSLLTIQTHIQLNLIGQMSYTASVNQALSPLSSVSTTQSSELSQEIECMYLTFSWWLLHRGWKIIGDRVRSAVEEELGPLHLKTPIVYGELSGLLSKIRRRIDFNPDGSSYSMIAAVSPTSLEEEIETLTSGGITLESSNIPPQLRNLLDETTDIFESSDCALVQRTLLDSLFSQLLSALEQPFRLQSRGAVRDQGSRFEDVTERTAKLASLLPTITRQSHLILNGLPNEYFDTLSELSELRDFSTILYSTSKQAL